MREKERTRERKGKRKGVCRERETERHQQKETVTDKDDRERKREPRKNKSSKTEGFFSRSDDPDCAVKFARLHQRGGRAWCAGKKTKNEWILIDLGVSAQVVDLGHYGMKHN